MRSYARPLRIIAESKHHWREDVYAAFERAAKALEHMEIQLAKDQAKLADALVPVGLAGGS